MLDAVARIKPSDEEVSVNPRSRSAVLRVAERTAVPWSPEAVAAASPLAKKAGAKVVSRASAKPAGKATGKPAHGKPAAGKPTTGKPAGGKGGRK